MLTQRLLNVTTVAKDTAFPVKNIINLFNIIKFKNIDLKHELKLFIFIWNFSL